MRKIRLIYFSSLHLIRAASCQVTQLWDRVTTSHLPHPVVPGHLRLLRILCVKTTLHPQHHTASHTQFKRECKRVCVDLLWGRTLLLVPQQASSSSLQKPATPRRGLEHASPRPQDQQQRHRFPTTAGSDPPQTGAPCACRTPALGYHSQSSDQGLHRTHAVNHPS